VVFRGVYAHKVRRLRFFRIKPMPRLRVEVTDECVERLIRCAYGVALLFTRLSGMAVFCIRLSAMRIGTGRQFLVLTSDGIGRTWLRNAGPPRELYVCRLRVSIRRFSLDTGFAADRDVSFPNCERFHFAVRLAAARRVVRHTLQKPGNAVSSRSASVQGALCA